MSSMSVGVGQGADAVKVMAVVLRCVGAGVDQASVFIAAFLRQNEDIGFFNEIEAFTAASSLTRYLPHRQLRNAGF